MKKEQAYELKVGDVVKRQKCHSFSVHPWQGVVAYEPKEGKQYHPGTIVYKKAHDVAKIGPYAVNYVDVRRNSSVEEKSIGAIELVEQPQEAAA